jgi:hypothetical protein
MSLLHPSRPDAPHLAAIHPRSAIPGGSFEVTGTHLLSIPDPNAPELPQAFFGQTPASFDLARPSRALIRVPGGAISSDLTIRHNGATSNVLHASIGVPMVEDLHVISNPAADNDGNLFAMVSGPRGEAVPVSIFRIARDLQVTPFARDIINVSAFTEGMGIATGIAFDREGNLYVGDRSGTIFKVSRSGEVFVFATLEPSVAFYHLCFRADGVLLVTAPTTSSHQPIYAIAPNGDTTVFFRGLGRPQGMAFDVDGNLYIAASLQGNRGIVRISREREAELFVAGNDLVGLCFLDDGCAALATNSVIFHTDLGVEGQPLL